MRDTRHQLGSHLSGHSPDSGRLSAIFRLIEARRNEIRVQPVSFAANRSGCSPRGSGTRGFASFQAQLCLRRLSHLTPAAVMPERAAQGARRAPHVSRDVSRLLSGNECPRHQSRPSTTIARRCDAFCTDRILNGRFCLSKHTENGDLGSPARRSALCLRSSPCGGLLPAHLRHSCTRRRGPLADPTAAARRRQRDRSSPRPRALRR